MSNREAWLEKSVTLLQEEVFKSINVTLPSVKVSVGFGGGRGAPLCNCNNEPMTVQEKE